MSRVTPRRAPRSRIFNPIERSAQGPARQALVAASLRASIEQAVEDEEQALERELSRFPVEERDDPALLEALRLLPRSWPEWRRTATATALVEDLRAMRLDDSPT